MVVKPYVYWGRHTTAKAYNKEAFRYGLGDGESGINLRSTIGKCVDLGLRIAFALTLVSTLFLFSFKGMSLYYLLVSIPFLIGFRPYWYHIVNWLRLKSSKYNFMVFLYSIYLLESTRFNYLKAYYKGFFKSPEYRKQAALELKKRFKI